MVPPTRKLLRPKSTNEWTEKSASTPERVKNVPYKTDQNESDTIQSEKRIRSFADPVDKQDVYLCR